MVSSDTAVTCVSFYIAGCVLTIIGALFLDEEPKADVAVLWPIHFAKWLLKSLFIALFTGWRTNP